MKISRSAIFTKNVLAPAALIVLAYVISPIWTKHLFTIAPVQTDGLQEIIDVQRSVYESDGFSEFESITLPDDWKFTARSAKRVRYYINIDKKHLNEGAGLLIPAYRHAIRVYYLGQLIEDIETEVVGLSQRIMPPVRLILPPAVEGEPYRLVVDVSSVWSAEAGMGRVWTGPYQSLVSRQTFLVRHNESIYWAATGVLLALTIYLAARSIIKRKNYLMLALVAVHFVFIYLCTVKHIPIGSALWNKIYFCFLAAALVGWIEHGFRLIGKTAGRLHWLLVPQACALFVLFAQADADNILYWKNIWIILLLLTAAAYCYCWANAAEVENAPLYLKVMVALISVIMSSAAISDLIAIQSVGAIEHSAGYRYLAVFVTPIMFIPWAIQAFETELKLREMQLELARLVDKRTLELVSAQSRIQQNERLKTTYLLASGLSHEIKNPLATLAATLSVIKSRQGDESPAGRPLEIERMERSVKRIDQTIRDLNVQASAQTVQLQFHDFSDWVTQYFLDDHDTNFLDDFEVELDVEPDIEIHFDPGKMYRVLTNLIQNANRACSSESVMQLHIAVRTEGNYVQLKIRDNGRGFNELISDRVLEPLVSGNQLGLGLGLAFVRDIVEKHGGSFVLENNLGAKGATASVFLPKS